MERKPERRPGQRPAFVLKTTDNAILAKETKAILLENAHEEALEENAIRNISALESDIGDIIDPYYGMFADRLPPPEKRQEKKKGLLPFLKKATQLSHKGTTSAHFYTDQETGASYSYELEYRRTDTTNELETVKLFINDGQTDAAKQEPTLTLKFEEKKMKELHLNLEKMTIRPNFEKNFKESMTYQCEAIVIVDGKYMIEVQKKVIPLRLVDITFPYSFELRSQPIDSSGLGCMKGSFKFNTEKNCFPSEYSTADSCSKEDFLDLLHETISVIPTLDIDEKK